MSVLNKPRQLLKFAKRVFITNNSGYLNSSKSLNTCNSRYAIEKIKETVAGSNLFQFHGIWPAEEQNTFVKDMRLITNFITEDEETKLFEEIEPHMKRMRYEFDHWDDAIHGFRETERKHWYPHNRTVLDRIQQVAFQGQIMPYVHVLDLSEEGVIKPHVDSTRYCGTTISGISLLSDCVMRLVRTDETKYKQIPNQITGNNELNPVDTPETNKMDDNVDDGYRSQPKTSLENNFYADILLPRRSLYIMSYSSRYNFTHEVLANDVAKFRGDPIKKTRRISIICRNEP